MVGAPAAPALLHIRVLPLIFAIYREKTTQLQTLCQEPRSLIYTFGIDYSEMAVAQRHDSEVQEYRAHLLSCVQLVECQIRLVVVSTCIESSCKRTNSAWFLFLIPLHLALFELAPPWNEGVVRTMQLYSGMVSG